MIPARHEIHPVILKLLLDRETLSSDDIRKHVASHFRLTDEEMRRMRGPHTPEYVNETAWALVDLQRDGMIKKPDPKRLAYRITDSGNHAAAG